MIIIAYDISDTKLRTKVSNFLERYGTRIQYSIFQCKYSYSRWERIVTEFECSFQKSIRPTDSIIFWYFSNDQETNVKKYGYSYYADSSSIVITPSTMPIYGKVRKAKTRVANRSARKSGIR